jgi:hypothetical protein
MMKKSRAQLDRPGGRKMLDIMSFGLWLGFQFKITVKGEGAVGTTTEFIMK